MNLHRLCAPVLGATALLTAITACAFSAKTPAPDADHGRYLVEQVGMCWDCHSPRDQQGQIIPEQWLQGAALPFVPTVPMPWAPVSKPIAGLPTLTDDQALTFLTTGVLPGGRASLPPMPQYRFSPADARDVIAYLRQPTAPSPAVTAAGPQPTR
jgi:mono/diheme cytochrome c family protein